MSMTAFTNIPVGHMGARYLMRMLRGYGVTFLIIQGYTLYSGTSPDTSE